MEFFSAGFIKGFVLGIQTESLDENEVYLLISLGIFEIIFVW